MLNMDFYLYHPVLMVIYSLINHDKFNDVDIIQSVITQLVIITVIAFWITK